MTNETIRRMNKEKAKADFIDKLSKIEPPDITSPSSFFKYFTTLDVLLNDLYNTGFNDGFQKAIEIDVKQN